VGESVKFSGRQPSQIREKDMAKPILHGGNLSPFVRKVRVALAEKGIAYESVPVVPVGQSREYLRISPLGKIPCYQEGEFILPDSSAILAYLERKQPNPPLYPSDPEQYGRALWYEEYADTKVAQVLSPAFFQRFVRPRYFKQPADEALIRKTIAEDAPPVFDYLEGELSDREFLAGGRFSVADIATATFFVNFAHAGEQVDASRWPSLVEYLARIHARPSFKAIIEGEKAEAAA
jgi:glutathione S-transferase